MVAGDFTWPFRVPYRWSSRVALYTAGHLHTAVPHCSHSRAPGEQWARLCVFTLQGCMQAARLCRGSPVVLWVWNTCFFSKQKFRIFYVIKFVVMCYKCLAKERDYTISGFTHKTSGKRVPLFHAGTRVSPKWCPMEWLLLQREWKHSNYWNTIY